MDNSRVSTYDGGYSSNFRRSVDSIQLPEWLTCCQCGIRQSKAWYSKASLTALRNRVYKEGTHILADNHAGLIRCSDCAGNLMQSERKCVICGEAQTLDKFAKNQRQYAEPTCIACQDFMMNNDDEFKSRDKRRESLRGDENQPANRAIEGPAPAPRRRLALPVTGNNNSGGFPYEPSPLSRDQLMDHDGVLTESGSTQPSVTERASSSASNPATALPPLRTENDDKVQSTAGSTLISNDGSLLAQLNYGSDNDTIVPRNERSRTGWAKIRPNRHRRGNPE